MKTRHLLSSMLLSALVALGSAGTGHAQVTPEEASAFLGDWTATIAGPQGSLDLAISLEDEGGELTGQVTGSQGAPSEVEEFSMTDESLTMSYTVDFGGQSAPIDFTLTPSGEDEMEVVILLGGGQLPGGPITGTAVRQ